MTFEHVLMLILGLLSHTLSDLINIKNKEGVFLTLFEYFLREPYQHILSTVTCIAGFILLKQSGELTLLSCYTLGLASNVFMEKLTQGYLDKLNK